MAPPRPITHLADDIGERQHASRHNDGECERHRQASEAIGVAAIHMFRRRSRLGATPQAKTTQGSA
jgi:hypothetical protein